MIILYEGLPRSGKSYSAIKNFVVTLLKKGRHIYANIAGLNYDQLAVLAEIEPEKCRELLHFMTDEEVMKVYETVTNDAFVIIDEVHNYWPDRRGALPPEIVNFITQHGHRGLDILLGSQDFTNVHKQWVTLAAQKTYFQKREVLGKPNEFTATVYKPRKEGQRVKWLEVQQLPKEEYDARYFGAYKSHDEGTNNKEILVDSSAVIWNSPIFKKWLPIFGGVFVFALWYLYHTFTGGLENSIVKTAQTPRPEIIKSAAAADMPPQIAKTETVETKVSQVDVQLPDEPLDYIDQLTANNRIRFAGAVTMKGQTAGIVEWRGDGFEVRERLTLHDLAGLGWSVFVNQSGTVAFLQKNSRKYIATAWPISDPQGRVPEQKQLEIAGGNRIVLNQ